jgi:succinoglycan biosynthesis protein ExoA
MTAAPTVSIILPTLNERGFIRDCLDSLLAQDYASVAEILVADGGSDDGTREIVARAGGNVRLVDNPGVSAAAGMNTGLACATGDVVVRADAHTLYAGDYVRRCVAVLLETGADNVGGPMRPVGTSNFGRAVAAVTSSPFGVGPGRFHYADRRQDVDTVYLGCWYRATLEALGGYDESRLQWAAEDQELNFRLRRRRGRVVVDPTIRSWYFPRGDPAALARQYFNYGMAKASTLAKHRSLPSWRPLAPAGLVAVTALAAASRGLPRLVVPAAHAGACAAVAARLAKDPGVAFHRAWGALAICHWSYGLGVWSGLGRILTGRGFDQQPRRRATGRRSPRPLAPPGASIRRGATRPPRAQGGS